MLGKTEAVERYDKDRRYRYYIKNHIEKNLGRNRLMFQKKKKILLVEEKIV